MRIGLGIVIVLASLALVASPLVAAVLVHPTSIDWVGLRFEQERGRPQALAGHAAEIRARDEGWNRGRTEMEFLAQYEKLRARTQTSAFRQGFRPGRTVSRQIRCGRHGTLVCRDLDTGARVDPRRLANATGEPVDVIIR